MIFYSRGSNVVVQVMFDMLKNHYSLQICYSYICSNLSESVSISSVSDACHAGHGKMQLRIFADTTLGLS